MQIYHFLDGFLYFCLSFFFLLLNMVAASANSKRENMKMKAILLRLDDLGCSYGSRDYYLMVDFFFAFILLILFL